MKAKTKGNLAKSNAFNRGFSLIEIILAMGLAAFVATAMMQVFSTQQGRISQLEDKEETNDIKEDVEQVMDHPQSCLANFQGKGVGDELTALVTRVQNTNVPIMRVRRMFRKFMVRKIRIARIEQAAGMKRFAVDIVLTNERAEDLQQNDNSDRRRRRIRRFIKRVYFLARVNNQNKVSSCEGAGEGNLSAQAACNSVSGIYDTQTGICSFSRLRLGRYLKRLTAQNIVQARMLKQVVNEINRIKRAIFSSGNNSQRCQFLGGEVVQGRCQFRGGIRREVCVSFGGVWQENAEIRCSLMESRMCERFGGTWRALDRRCEQPILDNEEEEEVIAQT